MSRLIVQMTGQEASVAKARADLRSPRQCTFIG